MPEKQNNNCMAAEGYRRTQMHKDRILKKLRENGCRITKQRRMLLDIILKEDCSCCKEIYYKALQKDEKIGSATVYRMINTLEEIGAISRKNMYRINCEGSCMGENTCTVELDDDHVCQLSGENWSMVLQEGLKACGYIQNQKVKSILVHTKDLEQ